jgi:predicted dehydrogenase
MGGTDRVRVVQVGVGFWGWSWVQVAAESPAVELAGIVEPNAESRRRACERYGIEPENCFETLDAAVRKLSPEAALVIVGAERHAEVTTRALESGLHCLVEKPIALTMGEARRMVKAAARSGRNLMVSQNYRFRKPPRTVRRFLGRSEVIGAVGNVYVNFQKAPKFVNNFRTEIEEPLITDMAIHHFDQMRSVLGLEPVSVLASSWNTRWSNFRSSPVATIVFEMTGGVRVTYTGNWVSKGWQTPWDGDWVISCDGGEVRWVGNRVSFRVDNLLHEVHTRGAVETAGELVLDHVELPAEDRSGALLEFAASIREKREPETSGRDNLNTLAMVLGACRSIRERRPVEIGEVLAEEPAGE